MILLGVQAMAVLRADWDAAEASKAQEVEELQRALERANESETTKQTELTNRLAAMDEQAHALTNEREEQRQVRRLPVVHRRRLPQRAHVECAHQKGFCN